MTENSSNAWRPLFEREKGLTGERELVEGVPDYMLPTLRSWVDVAVRAYQMDDSLRLRLRREFWVIKRDGRGRVVTKELPWGDDLLTLIDAVLHVNKDVLDYGEKGKAAKWVIAVKELHFRLWEGGSMWQPNEHLTGLEKRVDETVRAAYQKAVADAEPDAATHLREAWAAAYAFQPDPSKAFSKAIKAVEAVSIPHFPVTVNNTKATLGHVIPEVRNGGWNMVIDDKDGNPASAEAVLSLMELIWHGQRDRHGGPAEKPVTQEGAETAVHAAATLVQWFTKKAIVKGP